MPDAGRDDLALLRYQMLTV